MGILMWIGIGLAVSVLTLIIEPYIIRRHILITILLGVTGAVIGGAIGTILSFATTDGMRFMTVVLAVAGAVFILTGYRAMEHA